MLTHLHIENLAVIESVDLDFRSGFSVLTGETGAGKSVLIHSLNLILGERIGKDLIRSGCEKATVSALFSALPSAALQAFSEQGFDAEDEVLIQRELSLDGRSSVRINGRPATVSMLRDLSGFLVNIHGQHDNRALLDPATHVNYLDEFAGNGSEKEEYKRIFRELKQVLNEIASVNTDEQSRMQRLDMLDFQIAEIDDAALQPDEEERLTQRRDVLSHAEKIESALNSAYLLCAEENNAKDKLFRASSDLENVRAFDPTLEDLSVRLVSICEELDDLCGDLRDFLDTRSFDPTELDEVESRLDLIYRLKRKYGASVAEVLAFRDRAYTEREALTSSAENLDRLNQEKERLFVLLKKAAAALTESRMVAAKKLESVLTDGLAFLDMPNTGFRVRIVPAGTFTPNGADAVEFLLSANLGETLRPLSKIASGGELSRIMLCMKTVLQGEDDAQTLIFDEVDTGVSGKAAEKIAMKLKEISADKQVVVVTHLAQIAAYAHQHYLISKSVTDQRTFTAVTPLNQTGRVQELARIIGGITPTEATLAAAEDLLRHGCEYSL